MKTTQSPEYRKAFAVAKSIPTRKNKRPAILFWCQCAKEMIIKGGGENITLPLPIKRGLVM